jgi:hypothetical protein
MMAVFAFITIVSENRYYGGFLFALVGIFHNWNKARTARQCAVQAK